MKKFRLFTLLAIVATISTSFAAWTYYNYGNQYTDVSDAITLSVDSMDIVGDDAIAIEITNTTMPTVTYVQNADNIAAIDAQVSGDVTIKVDENIEGAMEEYSYYYAVYKEYESGVIPNVKTLADFENDGAVILDAVKDNIINVSEEGTATITADKLAEIFATSHTLDTSNGNAGFQASLAEFNGAIVAAYNGGSPYLKVYAVKK